MVRLGADFIGFVAASVGGIVNVDVLVLRGRSTLTRRALRVWRTAQCLSPLPDQQGDHSEQDDERASDDSHNRAHGKRMPWLR